VRLAWATAQPVCAVDDGAVRTVFFAETKGMPAQFAVAGEDAVRELTPGRGAALQVPGAAGGSVRIVLLSDADSLALWKGEWLGRERVFLTRAGLMIDGDGVRLGSGDPAELSVGVYPAPPQLPGGVADGVFTRFTPPPPPARSFAVTVESVQPAGPPRDIPLGQATKPVAAEPSEADFASAAVWRIKLPPGLDPAVDPLLRIRYTGDVARLTLNGQLVTDDFFNGAGWEIGLRRYAAELAAGDWRVAILPLRRDAVTGDARKIYLAGAQQPDFGPAASVAGIQSIEIVPRYEVRLGAELPANARP